MAATATKQNNELRELLQVKSPDEVVDWLNFLVYGDAGVGKTYLGGTAIDDPVTSPLLVFDIEGGLTTLRKRKSIDVVPIRTMKELENRYNDLYKSIDSNGKLYYKSIMIDSLTELTDLDMKAIMKDAYGRNPDKVDIDVPSPREWGKARNHIRTIVRAFRDLPCNVIYTAHVGALQEEGQPTKFFPGFSGKLRTEVPGFMDIVGYLYAENEGGLLVRKLQLQGTRRVVAKDRTGVLGDVIENPTIPMMWEKINNG